MALPAWTHRVRPLFCACILLVALVNPVSPVHILQSVAATPLPFIQSGEVIGSDTAAGDTIATQIAISRDGTTAIIGAPFHNYGKGAGYIFVYNSGAWTQQAQLTASDGQLYDNFGSAVAVNSDGNTVIVGASAKNGATGAAYVFTRTGTTWSQQAELTALDAAASGGFGQAVALSSDGNTALIGSAINYVGAGYIFTRSGTTWSQQTKLVPADGHPSSYFASDLTLSADGNIAVIGAYGQQTSPGVTTGAVYTAIRSGATWGSLVRLTADAPTQYSTFGFSVALSDDGGTLAVGAPWQNNDQGYAYIFTGGGTTWTQRAVITATGLYPNLKCGYQVAVNTNGTTVVVSAPWDTATANSGYSNGAIYVFDGGGSSWTKRARIIANDAASNDTMGWSMGVSNDAGTIAAGAPDKSFDMGSGYRTGAADFFTTGTIGMTLPSSPVIAGTPPSVTVSVKDAANNLITGYRGTIHFTSTDPQAAYTGDYQFTPVDGGTKTFAPVMFKTAGSRTLTVTDTANAALTATAPVTIQPGPTTKFTYPNFPTSTTAGAPLSFTLVATDDYGNITTGYTGTVHFTASDPAAMLPADITFGVSDAGTKALSMTFNTGGMPSLTATDSVHGAVTGSVTGVIVTPTITAVTPASGPTGGGNIVTITGTGFAVGMTVSFAGAAASVVSVNTTAVAVTVPAHAAGQVAVTITVNGQQASLPNGYTYGVVQSMPPPSSGGASGSSTPAPNPAAASGQRTTATGTEPPAPLPTSR